MAKDPAFPFYAGDFIMGTVLMTDEEVGKYIRLLCIQHQHGGIIPKDEFEDYVDGLTKVRRKFEECDEGFFNKRLMGEMIKRSKKSENLSANAKKRWQDQKQLQCKSNAKADARHMPSENENESNNKKINIEFEKFWKAFDYKVGKKTAERFWGKLKSEDRVQIMVVVSEYVSATFTDGKFPSRMHPSTYLNPANRRWEDDIPVNQDAPKPVKFIDVRCTECDFKGQMKKLVGTGKCPKCGQYAVLPASDPIFRN